MRTKLTKLVIGLSPMGMSSVKQDVWFGWNVKNFAQNLLISPRSTQKRRGGQSTANSEVVICRWGGRGEEGWGGQSMVNLERIREDFGRITSDNVGLGGSMDGQLGKDLQRLWKDYL